MSARPSRLPRPRFAGRGRPAVPGSPPHENKFFKDFHVYPRAGYELNLDSVATPPGWKKEKAGGGGVVCTDDANNGDGSYAFTLNVAVTSDKEAAATTNELVDIILTHTGKAKREPGDSFGTDSTKRAPSAVKSLVGSTPFETYWSAGYSIPIGQTSTFTFSFGGAADAPYQVYRAKEANDDWSDPFGLGIQFPSDPIPPAWGLTYSGLVGVMNASGEATIQVTVPNNPALEGNVFYLCGALKDENGDIVAHANDIKVTIVE